MLDPELLRHELTHAILRDLNVCSPTWLVEGVAEYASQAPTPVSRQVVGPASYQDLMAADRVLPQTALWSNDARVNYTIARGAVSYLADRYGLPRLIDLMSAYSQCRSRDWTGDSATRSLLRQTYGITEGDLVRGAFTVLSQMRH
jgi:hypothetical protein